jgi:hypothetical protein
MAVVKLESSLTQVPTPGTVKAVTTSQIALSDLDYQDLF